MRVGVFMVNAPSEGKEAKEAGVRRRDVCVELDESKRQKKTPTYLYSPNLKSRDRAPSVCYGLEGTISSGGSEVER